MNKCNNMQYNEIPCNNVQYNRIYYNIMQYHTTQSYNMQNNWIKWTSRGRLYAIMYHVSCIMYNASCIMHHASCIMCHVSCIKYHWCVNGPLRPVFCRKSVFTADEFVFMGLVVRSCHFDVTACTEAHRLDKYYKHISTEYKLKTIFWNTFHFI